jgi:predicted enzyme related to lactoylglutathione lyase
VSRACDLGARELSLNRMAGGTIALEVDDLPALVGRLKSLGVAIKAEGIRGPHCQMAVCLDSEGNSLLLHQLDAP